MLLQSIHLPNRCIADTFLSLLEPPLSPPPIFIILADGIASYFMEKTEAIRRELPLTLTVTSPHSHHPSACYCPACERRRGLPAPRESQRLACAPEPIPPHLTPLVIFLSLSSIIEVYILDQIISSGIYHLSLQALTPFLCNKIC